MIQVLSPNLALQLESADDGRELGAADLCDAEDDDGRVLVPDQVGLGEGHLLHRLPSAQLARRVRLGLGQGIPVRLVFRVFNNSSISQSKDADSNRPRLTCVLL